MRSGKMCIPHTVLSSWERETLQYIKMSDVCLFVGVLCAHMHLCVWLVLQHTGSCFYDNAALYIKTQRLFVTITGLGHSWSILKIYLCFFFHCQGSVDSVCLAGWRAQVSSPPADEGFRQPKVRVWGFIEMDGVKGAESS